MKLRLCSCGPILGLQNGIEFARVLERVKLIAAADVLCADENLRQRVAAVRAFGHLPADILVPSDIDFMEGHPLPGQELLGEVAVGAELPGVDFDRSHNEPLSPGL